MTSGEKPYIYYKGQRYREIGHRLKSTYEEGHCVPMVDVEQEEPVVDAEQEDPMVDDDGKRFADMLLKFVQDLSRQIEVMGQRFTAVKAKQHESPWVF